MSRSFSTGTRHDSNNLQTGLNSPSQKLAEMLPAMKRGAARLRIGTHQILVYRSLKPPAVNRTVLGLHTGDESVYGRVPAGGQIEPLVQVEGSAADDGSQST